MKTAIILHGMPSKEEYFDPKGISPSNRHWLPWLQNQLILNGILAQTPELPEPYAPDYEKWCSVFEQFKVDENTILVGHSCGAGFLVRWLSENKVRVGKVALVAPFLDPDKDEVPSGMFNFNIDQDLALRTQGIKIFVSSDDENEILDSVKQIKEKVESVQIVEFPDKGHFTSGDMASDTFLELAEWLIS